MKKHLPIIGACVASAWIACLFLAATGFATAESAGMQAWFAFIYIPFGYWVGVRATTAEVAP